MKINTFSLNKLFPATHGGPPEIAWRAGTASGPPFDYLWYIVKWKYVFIDNPIFFDSSLSASLLKSDFFQSNQLNNKSNSTAGVVQV